MIINPETFVIFFVMTSIVGCSFNYVTVALATAYISGMIFAVELSKNLGAFS